MTAGDKEMPQKNFDSIGIFGALPICQAHSRL
jgi:hypothetical protein